jgi:hypothetical protein
MREADLRDIMDSWSLLMTAVKLKLKSFIRSNVYFVRCRVDDDLVMFDNECWKVLAVSRCWLLALVARLARLTTYCV